MLSTTVFTSFPLTEPPPAWLAGVMDVFRSREEAISTERLEKGLTSDQVLAVIRSGLCELGYQVESGKSKSEKIYRPVLFGENGHPVLRYEVDAFHAEWRCGMEVEAGRGIMGNALYRDLIQAMIMVEVDYLILAFAKEYKYSSGGSRVVSHDYKKACEVAQSLFGNHRVQMPYKLIVIGY